jgi:hypothetical protein
VAYFNVLGIPIVLDSGAQGSSFGRKSVDFSIFRLFIVGSSNATKISLLPNPQYVCLSNQIALERSARRLLKNAATDIIFQRFFNVFHR